VKIRLASVTLRRGILILLCAAGVASAALAGGPDSRTQPLLDGCTRERTAILAHDVPNWVYVGGDEAAQLQSLSGVVDSKFEPDLAAHPTGIDDPLTHTSYDFTFNVKVDPEFASLLGTGNEAEQTAQTGRIHVERETRTFPVFAWPDRGDRVRLTGSWVWDCDHSDPETGERTEIHPFRVLWVERNPGGSSPRSPAGDREADLFVTGASTPADTQAICAHRTKGDRAAFKECLTTPAGPLDPGGPECFVLRASKRPSSSARLVRRVVGAGHVDVRRVSRGVSVCFGEAPGRIAKRVFVGWRPARRPLHLRVRLRELLVRRAMDPGCPPHDPGCPARDESTRIGQNTKPPGEWNVYVNAGGVWAPWRPILIHPNDGDRIQTRQAIDFYVQRGKPWRLFVQTRECDFGLPNAYLQKVAVDPCPRLPDEVGSTIGDDVPGVLVDHFRSARASLGTHRTNSQLTESTCPASNRHGCFQLTYTVSLVRRGR
jgi:hypothetical protein